jgi:hypothetical protein
LRWFQESALQSNALAEFSPRVKQTPFPLAPIKLSKVPEEGQNMAVLTTDEVKES